MRKVPKLRFKEFSDEWKEKKLREIIEISNLKYNPTKENKKYPCIELESLTQETGKILNQFNSLEQKSIKNKFNKEEILFGKLRPYLKKYYFTEFEGVCSSEIWVFTSKINIKKFIYYFIQTEKFLTLANTTSGTKMPRADWSLMKDENFLIPSLQEQGKIANFLSSVDKKISLTEEKLELFREYKKGVMQKIFSQELRFKDSNGNDYPEWEEKKLEDIVNINKGKQVNKELLEKQGEYPVINGGILPSGYTDKYNTLSNTITISEGGNSCGYVNFIKNNFWAGGHCYTLNKKIEINYKYLYQLLKFNEVNIMDLRVGSGLPNIQKSAINNYKVNISTTLEEQQKIADFLSSIDSKIESIEKELERLKEFKRGLLQQMFV